VSRFARLSLINILRPSSKRCKLLMRARLCFPETDCEVSTHLTASWTSTTTPLHRHRPSRNHRRPKLLREVGGFVHILFHSQPLSLFCSSSGVGSAAHRKTSSFHTIFAFRLHTSSRVPSIEETRNGSCA
jgi:hypothetical protein